MKIFYDDLVNEMKKNKITSASIKRGEIYENLVNQYTYDKLIHNKGSVSLDILQKLMCQMNLKCLTIIRDGENFRIIPEKSVNATLIVTYFGNKETAFLNLYEIENELDKEDIKPDSNGNIILDLSRTKAGNIYIFAEIQKHKLTVSGECKRAILSEDAKNVIWHLLETQLTDK